MKQKRIFQISHVSIPCLLRMLLRNCWMIGAMALIAGMAVSLALTWTYDPTYQATMTYAVTSRTTSVISTSNMASTKEVASVLTELLTTDVMDTRIREHDPRLKDFDGTITARQVTESNFIVVTATAGSPEQAFLALKALIQVFPELADFISNRNVLTLMRNPTVSAYPSNQVDIPGMSRMGGLAGAAMMAGLLCFMSIQSDTIQTRTAARELLDAPILATICHERKNRTLKSMFKRTNRQVHVYAPTTSFSYAEQISAVCTHLENEAAARQKKIFLITGVGESEGKSTVSANVAAALALKGHKVALVDCDLRKPAMNTFFDKVYTSPLPLNRMLALPYAAERVRQCMVLNEELGLYMLFPVNGDLRSAELLSGSTLEPLLQQLRVFDFVIVDSPPMGMFPDAEIIAEMVDASMLVVRQDYTAACDVNDAIDTLNGCNSEFLGVILNDMLVSGRSRYGYGYGYGYGYSYSNEKYRYGSKDFSSQTSGYNYEHPSQQR